MESEKPDQEQRKGGKKQQKKRCGKEIKKKTQESEEKIEDMWEKCDIMKIQMQKWWTYFEWCGPKSDIETQSLLTKVNDNVLWMVICC